MTSHRTILAFLLCLICIAHLPVNAQDSSTAMLIPIEREIDMAAFRHVKRGCTQAADENASLIIVQLNTYGGALDAADSIRSLLLRQTLPTVAWVNHNAASAGALIALACDSVFMATDASMGSATVVNGAGEPMPTKYQSYMATIMAATAEHHGRHTAGPDCGMWLRDPQTARAMVNPDSSLSLTAGEAIACGYAEGIADSLEEIASRMDMQGTRVVTYKATLGDDILGFLASAGVRAILVMLILGGIYMEMHTPGLGFAAAVALVAAVLYFLPMFATGSIEGWVVITFIAGIVLIALELFVIPGFGIAGIAGIVAVAVSLVAAAMGADSVTGFDMSSAGHALAVTGAGAILAVILVLWLTSSRGPKFFRRHAQLTTVLSNADGFVGVDMQPARYVGQTGRAVTILRPAGKIEIGNHIFDAVSTGEFISEGKTVKVVKYENAQLYVCAIPSSEK